MSEKTKQFSVLIVDDEAEIVGMLQEFLEHEFMIHTASDGASALAILEREPVDIILCDQKMPGMKGTDMLQRSIGISPASERIVFTAYADLDTVIACINDAKVSHILTKPIDPQYLLHTVQQAAVVVRLRRENARLMARLQRHNDLLTDEVARRTAELRTANRELQRLQESREQMFRMAVHDMKNPLSNLKLAVGGIRRLNGSESADFLNIADDSLNALNDLVVDMLSVASLSSDSPEIPKRPMQLLSILSDSITAFRQAATNKSISLTEEFPDNLPLVEAHERRLREAFDNLISNALKYTSEHGAVRVSASEEDDTITVSISDTGLGMTSEDIQSAFGEFQKLSARPTGGESSTGLGLFIVKRIINLHGGSVSIVSAGKNHGTSFIVKLPAVTLPVAQKTD